MGIQSIDVLRASLEELAALPSERLIAGLSERKRKELEFHDLDRDRSRINSLDRDTYEKFYGNRKYYEAARLSKHYVDAWIRSHAAGKVFLDYACGNGLNAIKAAEAGARLAIGIDISPVSIENCRLDAKSAGVTANTFFVQGDAESTGLPDASVDVVICSGMLHHLDLSYAFPELRRILAPRGVILGVEALDYNPLIKLYRYLTPDMRTEWEKAHILSLRDLRFAERFFDLGEIRYFHITSIAGGKWPGILPALDLADRVLTRLPLVKLLAWIFTFELRSKNP